jgi:hypothetical protein
MKKLDRDNKTAEMNIPKQGGSCMSLSSNKGRTHPPFLGVLLDNKTETENKMIEYLAEILIDIFLTSENFNGKPKTSSNILQGVDERTG